MIAIIDGRCRRRHLKRCNDRSLENEYDQVMLQLRPGLVVWRGAAGGDCHAQESLVVSRVRVGVNDDDGAAPITCTYANPALQPLLCFGEVVCLRMCVGSNSPPRSLSSLRPTPAKQRTILEVLDRPPAAASSSSSIVAPKMTTPSPQPAAVPKSVVFATSGLGGMIGWVVVHPANTTAGASN